MHVAALHAALRHEGAIDEGRSEVVVETKEVVTTVTKVIIVEEVVTRISTPLPTPPPIHSAMPESSERPPPEREVMEEQNKTPKKPKNTAIDHAEFSGLKDNGAPRNIARIVCSTIKRLSHIVETLFDQCLGLIIHHLRFSRALYHRPTNMFFVLYRPTKHYFIYTIG